VVSPNTALPSEVEYYFSAIPPVVAAPSELNSSSIDVLRAEMDEMIAWSNKLHFELDLNYADQYTRMDRLVSAQNELLIKYDVLQSKFDHFIDEHWRPMQHFACGVVSCLAVFAGDTSFELPFNVGVRGEPGAPFPPPLSRCEHTPPDTPLSSEYFSDTGVGIDSLESLPSLLSQSSHSSLPSPPSSSGSWDEIEPHFIYSQLDAGRRQLSLLSRREVSARQDAMTYLVRVRELLNGW